MMITRLLLIVAALRQWCVASIIVAAAVTLILGDEIFKEADIIPASLVSSGVDYFSIYYLWVLM